MFDKEHRHVPELAQMRKILNDLYIHIILQAFAISMVSVFIPIYLLNLNFSLSSVFIFLFIQWGVFALFSPIAGHMVKHIGIKEVILIRTPLYIAALILLYFMKTNIFLQGNYYIVAFLIGFSSVLYTLSVQSLFAECVDRKKEGIETGGFLSLPTLGMVAGPFIGGLISAFFGFKILFAAVSIMLFLSVLPLFRVKHNLDHPSFSMKKLLMKFKENRKIFFMLLLYGIKGMAFFLLLPIAIYLINKDVLSLGIVLSLISLLGITFSFFIGYNTDRYGKMKMMRIGCFANALFLLILGLVTGSSLLIYLALFSGFITYVLDVPMESLLYEKATI